MDRSKTAYLISRSYETDAIAQKVPVTQKRKVFVAVQSVGQSEFFQAGQAGIRAEFMLTMFAPEYHGEQEVELDGVEYSIYRTYLRKDEGLELYVRKLVGNG